MRSIYLFLVALALTFAVALPAAAQSPEDVPKMTVAELQARIDKGEDIVIIDTRVRGTYQFSAIKIKGAIDIPILETAERIGDLPFGVDIVTYCT